MEYLKQFQKHIASNDLPSIVSLWQEYCLSDELDVEELKLILTSLKQSPLIDSFGCYVEQILVLWEDFPEGEQKDEVLKLVFDIQTTNEASLADLATSFLEKRYGTDKHYQHMLRLVGLRDRISFQYALRNYELLMHMKKGNYFIHTGGWGVGEVVDISMLREQITLEFDYVAGNKELSFVNAFKMMVPISDEHFLARRFGDPEAFEVFAKENPVETVRMLLRDLGPKTAMEIKDELEELVIPEDLWTRWWQTTRTKLKKDTFIETPTSLKHPFRLRKEEVTHEERLQKALLTKPDANALIEMVYSFMRDFPVALKGEEFRESLKQQLIDLLSHKELTDSQEIQILFILQDLQHEKATDLKDLISGFSNIERVINGMKVLAYRKRMLVAVKDVREDWAAVFAALIPAVDQNPLRDYLLEELVKAKEEKVLNVQIEYLLDTPNRSPNAFLWYFQKIMSNEKYPYSNQDGKDRFFESFFILLHLLEPLMERRDVVKKMHNFLSSGRFAHVRKIFEGASIEVVKEILLLSTKCHTLTDHDVKILYSLAEVVHPSIAKLRKVESEDEELEVLWTTSEGFQKIQQRIEKIATVEVVENAKEIEVARSHGDLRENSEFKFAQERRSRLQSELKFLSGQVKMMRVLTAEDIDTSQVSVGTVVSLQSESGENVDYTLLGPWDADPEKNILSFQSRLAKNMIGLIIGNDCEIQGKEWKVKSIKAII